MELIFSALRTPYHTRHRSRRFGTKDRIQESSGASLSRSGSTGKGVQFIERSIDMKRNLLLVLAVLGAGLQSGLVQASPYPMDAEANYALPPADTYADQQVRMGETANGWGVSRRVVQPHDPFPFGGGYIDD
jgi:hypothetical protein